MHFVEFPGEHPLFEHNDAAYPTAAPICPVVRITLGPPIPTWLQLKHLPAMNRLVIFFE